MKITSWLAQNSTAVILTLIDTFAVAFFVILVGYLSWLGIVAGGALARDDYREDQRHLDSRLQQIYDKMDNEFKEIRGLLIHKSCHDENDKRQSPSDKVTPNNPQETEKISK